MDSARNLGSGCPVQKLFRTWALRVKPVKQCQTDRTELRISIFFPEHASASTRNKSRQTLFWLQSSAPRWLRKTFWLFELPWWGYAIEVKTPSASWDFRDSEDSHVLLRPIKHKNKGRSGLAWLSCTNRFTMRTRSPSRIRAKKLIGRFSN